MELLQVKCDSKSGRKMMDIDLSKEENMKALTDKQFGQFSPALKEPGSGRGRKLNKEQTALMLDIVGRIQIQGREMRSETE